MKSFNPVSSVFYKGILKMIKNKFSKNIKEHFLIAALMIGVVVVLGGLRIMYYIKSPEVVFLANRAGAQWIKYDSEFQLEAKPASKTQCQYKYVFNTSKEISNARIAVQALKRCQIFLDGVNIFSSAYEFDHWKKTHDIEVPFAVNAGTHEIIIIVTSENSYPAVIAYSETLPVKTGAGWFASIDGKSWWPAAPASEIKQPAESREFPSATAALIVIMPYLAVVFLMTFIISLLGGMQEDRSQKVSRWRPEPSLVRWALLVSWAALAINNMFRLNFQVGSDIMGHTAYIDYIVIKGSLPLASDGWEMFQPPLNYMLSAPLYALLIKFLDLSWIVKMLRIIPIICGLLQIEIVYRAARLVFAQRKDLQIIAIVAGSLLPIHTYTCQVVSNEPLAGCFISLMVLLCMSLVMPAQKERKYRYFVLLGFVWGLALLSKTTAILFAPVMIIVLLYHTRLAQRSLKSAMKPAVIIFGVSLLIAGWYYLRNYIVFGSPLVFNQTLGTLWWQDQSYRTWSQVLSFGQSLVHPVYAGVKGFGDTIYSTLWLDGFNSGLADFIPWNENFMIAGALLALLPSLFILTGVIFAGINKTSIYRNTVVFSIGTIALFLAATMDVYIRFPVYSTAKASYTLGLLPCYAILIAAGAEPFLRNKIIRSLTLALFACWAFAAYAAYFVVKCQ
jgi:hypothetical protein